MRAGSSWVVLHHEVFESSEQPRGGEVGKAAGAATPVTALTLASGVRTLHALEVLCRYMVQRRKSRLLRALTACYSSQARMSENRAFNVSGACWNFSSDLGLSFLFSSPLTSYSLSTLTMLSILQRPFCLCHGHSLKQVQLSLLTAVELSLQPLGSY